MKFLTLTIFTLIVCSASAAVPRSASATLVSPSVKSLKAEVQFKDTGDEIKVMARVTGLAPGAVHGIHIHEKGQCQGPDFESAGGHLNPEDHTHAGPGARKKHLGDFGNIVADDKGVGTKEIIIKKMKGDSMEQILGKAMIIHAKADDLSSQPSGNSGERIACGIIQGKS
jgi:superoxide dismutase, Cu-Zn family